MRIWCACLSVFVLFTACKDNSLPKEVKTQKREHLRNNDDSSPITATADTASMVLIPGGILSMGADSNDAGRDEYPKHKVQIDSFYLEPHEVTNLQFKSFVEESGYITVAERPIDWAELKQSLPPNTPKPPDEVLQPGAMVFRKTTHPVPLNDYSKWWEWVIGASWKHPDGPGSTIDDKMDHPVVQIAWEDANAYASYYGKRLPSEAEWEWASRGGEENMIYPWGNTLDENQPQANFWQGIFPYDNKLKDGFMTTAPVKSFPPNKYGLYDMAGNVWEWCSDWYLADFYSLPQATNQNNQGPNTGVNPHNPYEKAKVVRGGSFLCNDSYCSGYRNARRMQSSPDSGLNHTGFRCAADVRF